MIRGKSLNGKLLIGINDGKNIGDIKDLVLNETGARLAAIVVNREGLISKRTMVVSRTFVQVFGEDAWLLSDSNSVMDLQDMDNASRFIDMADMRGREVQTDNGTKLGTVGDVLLGEEEIVVGFALDTVAVEGPIAEKGYIPLNAIKQLPYSPDKPIMVDMGIAETETLAD